MYVYADHAATTPVHEAARKAMLHCLEEATATPPASTPWVSAPGRFSIKPAPMWPPASTPILRKSTSPAAAARPTTRRF